MMRAATALMLLLRFLGQVIRCGLTTSWLIVRPATRPVSGLVRMHYHDLSDVGVTLLASMITLTPGTTAIDIDSERGQLLLHLLDMSDPAGTVARIRSQFERPLQRLFPDRSQA